MRNISLTIVIMLTLCVSANYAQAAVPLCLTVHAQAGELDNFRRLVIEELGHHSSHRLTENNCLANLNVDFLRVGKQAFLTARIDQEVPVRLKLDGDDDLDEKLKDAISLVLQNEPQYLQEDISRLSSIQQAAHQTMKRGQNIYRLELLETIVTAAGHETMFAPGASVAMTRGAGHWQVAGRTYIAGWPLAESPKQLTLRLQMGMDANVVYEFDELSSFSFYLSAGAGVQLLSFSGRVDPQDAASVESMTRLGFAANARAGVRFFRWMDFDFDLFAAGYLPMFRLSESGNDLMDNYTPALQFGVGVGF